MATIGRDRDRNRSDAAATFTSQSETRPTGPGLRPEARRASLDGRSGIYAVTFIAVNFQFSVDAVFWGASRCQQKPHIGNQRTERRFAGQY